MWCFLSKVIIFYFYISLLYFVIFIIYVMTVTEMLTLARRNGFLHMPRPAARWGWRANRHLRVWVATMTPWLINHNQKMESAGSYDVAFTQIPCTYLISSWNNKKYTALTATNTPLTRHFLCPQVRSYTLSAEFDPRETVSYTVDTLDPNRVVSVPSLSSSAGLSSLKVVLASGNQTSTTERSLPPTAPAEPRSSRWQLRPDTTPAQAALQPPKTSEKRTPLQPRPNDISVAPRHKSAPAARLRDEPPRRAHHPGPSASLLTPGTVQEPSVHTLQRDGAVARAATRPDGSLAPVALRPDGSVSRVALRPDGPPVRLGGLRVWAVNSDSSQESGVPTAGRPRTGAAAGAATASENSKVQAGDRQAILRRIASHYRHRNGRHGHRRRRYRRKRKR